MQSLQTSTLRQHQQHTAPSVLHPLISHPLISHPATTTLPRPPHHIALSGRAIRHIGDYATIILADARFAKPSVSRRLPKWIGQQLKATTSFGEALGSVRSFFAARADAQLAEENKRRMRHEAGGEMVD